jgi:hypothetical protein
MFTLEESLSELKQCLEKTKLIKWEKFPLLTSTHERFLPLVQEIFELKRVEIRLHNPCSCIYMDKETAQTYEIEIPENVTLKPLTPEDHKLINDEWPYKYPLSDSFIESMIILNGGLGIYSENGQLLSWILQIECFGLG